ncbi:MAG: hypothetical protein IIT49_02955, partial [Clostridia bacterium]|nr:hypothetical protein [Clostridia bacterium]
DNEKEWYEKLWDDTKEWFSENYESFIAVVICIVIVVVLVVVTIATFGTAGLVAMAIYAGVAVANQLITDMISGEMSSWQTYVGAIAGGIVEGCLETLGLGELSGILSAGFTTFFTQNLENITGGEQRSSIAILLNTGVDMGKAALFDMINEKIGFKDVFGDSGSAEIFANGLIEGFLPNHYEGIKNKIGNFFGVDFEVGKLFDELTGGVSYTDIFNFTVDLFTGNDSNKKTDFDINADIEIDLNIDFEVNISIPDIMSNIVTNGFAFDISAYA